VAFPSFEFEHFADGNGHSLNSLLQSQLDVLKKFGCFVDLLFLSSLRPDLLNGETMSEQPTSHPT
jgi:hypothetical protein